MPDPKKGARPPPGQEPRPARPPPKIASPPPALETLGDVDLPLPSDRRSRALEPLKGALAERLQILQQTELSDDTLIQGYRVTLFGMAGLIVLQAAVPSMVPSLWGTFLGGPVLTGLPANLTGTFSILLALLLWLAYAGMHVFQAALLRRTASGFPYPPLQVAGMALVPGYNLYGTMVLFGEAADRLQRETDSLGQAALVRKLALASVVLGVLGWGLVLALELGVPIPDVASRSLSGLTALARLGTLAVCFLMMRKLIATFFEGGGLGAGPAGAGTDAGEGGEALPVPRAPAALSGGAAMTFLGLLVAAVITVYAVSYEELICGPESIPATTRTPEGKRVLYCSRDGLPHGTWRIRGIRGAPEVEETYQGGVRLGPVTFYWPGGRIKEQGSYEGDRKSGQWTSYSETGGKLQQLQYRDGKLQGPFERYYPDGAVSERGSYNDEKLDGLWVKFHPNGKKAEEGKYAAGKQVGVWTTWDKAGVILAEEDHGGLAGAPAEGTTGGEAAGTPGAGAPASKKKEEEALREVTEERLFGGHTLEWWTDRLNTLRRQVDNGVVDSRLYQLTLKRARGNGLEVQEAEAEVKVAPPPSMVAPAPEAPRP
jgi:antitoxin component YwqK of YwqJK toxin-antitoxin module